jgi:hypothetical protein
MLLFEGHVGGMPVEEALLALIPLASVLLLMTQLATRRFRETLLSTLRRTRRRAAGRG